MMRYRKKPVEIEAFQWAGPGMPHWLSEDAPRPPEWADKAYEDGIFWIVSKTTLAIRTLEGTMYAEPGSWIVRGVEGEIYAVKDSIFRKTYEPVE